MDEIGSVIGAHLTSALKRYYDQNKKLPGKIFIFRDGVGEGQLQVYDSLFILIMEHCRT